MNRSAELNLAWRVYSHARMRATLTALVVDEKAFSYHHFAAAAGRVASWLRGLPELQGRVPAPRVGILASRSFEAYAGIAGTVWAGGCYVPLGSKQPADRLNVILG